MAKDVLILAQAKRQGLEVRWAPGLGYVIQAQRRKKPRAA